MTDDEATGFRWVEREFGGILCYRDGALPREQSVYPESKGAFMWNYKIFIQRLIA
jgi:hypothetical protein